jgi:hypothetical protein
MKKQLSEAFGWAGGMLVLAVCAVVARRLGYIDRDTAERIFLGVVGLWMAWYGNRIPKTFVRSAQARQAKRVAGWSQVVSGLAYAGLWAFAPIPVAIWAGTAVVFAGLVVTLGYCLSLRAWSKAS